MTPGTVAPATGRRPPMLADPEPRPHRSLLTYYTLGSLLLGPLFFVALVPLYFRFHTLRYRFDDEGVAMSWGILFRREITLTYARIQDIHLVSNVVERWLGLARVQVQTASGNAGAEMTIEGLPHFAEVRDFLYSRMRGARETGGAARPAMPVTSSTPPSLAPSPAGAVTLDAAAVAELSRTLREVAAEVAALRRAVEGRDGAGGGHV